jgi:hypothetical protein
LVFGSNPPGYNTHRKQFFQLFSVIIPVYKRGNPRYSSFVFHAAFFGQLSIRLLPPPLAARFAPMRVG